MSYCIGCGQFLAQGIRFCRFCGSQQPNEQVIAMLQMEAQQIQALMFQQQQNMGQNIIKCHSRLHESTTTNELSKQWSATPMVMV